MIDLKQNKSWSHILVWGIIYILAIGIFSTGNSTTAELLLHTAVILSTQICIFYLNLDFLLPRFFEHQKYIIYGVLVIFTILICIWILNTLSMFSPSTRSDFMTDARLKARGNFFFNRKMILQGISMVGTLFISMIVRNVSQKRKKDKERIHLENKILSAESQLLKSQLNPHFLFNSLNNIYALSLAKSEKTPESILRLSELLSYVLYESEVEKVLLAKEIKYIESFVELQLLKDENSENIDVDFSGSNPDLLIAPMILISFIENCFKHSHFENSADNWIRIKMKTVGSSLHFEAENSIPPFKSKKDEIGGIGLENVRKRLDLIYSDRYQLEMNDDGATYTVNLKIELNDI